MSSPSSKQERRKKRRWGDASANATATAATSTAPTTVTSTSTSAAPKKASIDGKAKALALQSSIAARLAALKASKSASATAAATARPPSKQQQQQQQQQQQRPLKKAKVYDLDFSTTTPAFKKKQMEKEEKEKKEKKKKKLNPYLAHLRSPPPQQQQQQQQQDGNQNNNQNDSISKSDHNKINNKESANDEEIILDTRLKGGKNRMTKQRIANKKINFIEPGTYIEKAKKKHLSNLNAIQSGYRSGRKQGMYIEPTAIASIDEDKAADANAGDYYGTNENQDSRTLAPRVDAINKSNDSTIGGEGGTKHTNGVVPIPLPLVMEWWDMPLLPKQLRKEVVTKENELVMKSTKQRLLNAFKNQSTKKEINDPSKDKDDTTDTTKKQTEIQTLTQKCYITASITNSKTYKLIQHPKPVIPPSLQNQAEKPKPVLHLTKKELKKQRKLRRAEKQREIQDLQSVGLLPKPEPKLTLSNYMRVLGTQAVLDPSSMELKVQEQIQARKMKHEKMNLDRKIKANELRTLKKQQEGQDGTTNPASDSVSIALFLVQDMSHRYHRTKVDLNAQQLFITGGVLECQSNPKLALIIAEGDAKAIKKYIRLMTVRMKWKGENFVDGHDDEEEDEEEDNGMDIDNDNNGHDAVEGQNGEAIKKQQKFNKNNTCELVWTGMSAKRMFRSFIFQSCPTSDHARKVLEAKGVAHFWDQVLVHASGTGESFNFKLG